MKTGAGMLGIVGGTIALPIAALVGGAIAAKTGVTGGVLMLASAVGILIVLEIGVLSLITAIPIGLGAVLALVGALGSGG